MITPQTSPGLRPAAQPQRPSARRALPIASLLALLVACQAEQGDPCAALIAPASAIPVDKCPVSEVSSAALDQHVDPLTGKGSYFDKITGKYTSPPSVTPEANRKLSLWPLWNESEPIICRTCVSVCDCKSVSAVAPRCGNVLGNRHMPDAVWRKKRAGTCAGQEGLPPGTVRCVQGQCVLTPASATETAK